MCGITGLYALNNQLPTGLIEKMATKISHRGPDAEGFFKSEDQRCHLGHRRLSIIDLDESANQPMYSACKNYALVFNGEIYNYEKLRTVLEKEHRCEFSTESDSEVVLNSFKIWGQDCVEKFNGMFAFVVYHLSTKSLTIFRDRMGIKPLYYYLSDTVFAFSSELKGLIPLTKEFEKFTLNFDAVNSYFRLGYIPEPLSIYSEIKKFPAGHLATLNAEGLDLKPYWKLEDQITPGKHNNELTQKEQLNQIVKKSIKHRLKADVPLGVFLSGGVDSSLVAAVAQDINETPINTFSIGFREASFNESEYAKQVAEQLGTSHTSFTVSYQDALDVIPNLHKMYDEPFSDASAIPTYLVSKLARKKVKMVLTGDGGDEQFMGYGMYTWAKRLDNPVYKTLRKSMYFGLKNSGNNRLKRASEMFNFTSKTDLKSHIFSVDQYLFSENELPKILKKNALTSLKFSDIKLQRFLSPVEEQALFDLKYYLKDDLLVKVDRATMHTSLEARVPLLDHRLVEFSLNLDERLKISGKSKKYLLQELLFDYLPKELFDRPKWGFGLPIRLWLSNELKPLLEEHINETQLNQLGFFNTKEVLVLKKRFLAGEDYLYNKLWTIIIFVQWFNHNKSYLKNFDA